MLSNHFERLKQIELDKRDRIISLSNQVIISHNQRVEAEQRFLNSVAAYRDAVRNNMPQEIVEMAAWQKVNSFNSAIAAIEKEEIDIVMLELNRGPMEKQLAILQEVYDGICGYVDSLVLFDTLVDLKLNSWGLEYEREIVSIYRRNVGFERALLAALM